MTFNLDAWNTVIRELQTKRDKLEYAFQPPYDTPSAAYNECQRIKRAIADLQRIWSKEYKLRNRDYQ